MNAHIIDAPATPAVARSVDPAVSSDTDFDLDLVVEPAGERPDVMRIFASATESPCSCSTKQCH